MFYQWRPYVPVAERRRQAAREMQKRASKGHAVSPVVLDGRTIARTFWGKAWCDNLEGYSDFGNRLPRGQRYVRNGSVVDLQVAEGKITAVVSGSELYDVCVKISPLPKARWKAICADCSGSIVSLVELLQGRLSQSVMERMCRQKAGLFPAPGEIEMECSCPDWATMCKHVAAVLYGVGARLDDTPDLLFRLRGVDQNELIAKAGRSVPLVPEGRTPKRVVETDDLSSLFGLELDGDTPAIDAKEPKVRATKPKTLAAKSTKLGRVQGRGARGQAGAKAKAKAKAKKTKSESKRATGTP